MIRRKTNDHPARGVDSTQVKNGPTSASRSCHWYQLYHVQSSCSRKPTCHRFSVSWCLLISDEYDAKSFNPQPTARKWLFFTQVVLSIATIRTNWDLSSISLHSGSPRRRRNWSATKAALRSPLYLSSARRAEERYKGFGGSVAKESWPRRRKADGGQVHALLIA